MFTSPSRIHSLVFALLLVVRPATAEPVVCSVPGLFGMDAQWQTLTSSHAGCEGAQWVDGTLHYAAHHDGFAFQWSEAAGLVIWRKDSPEATSFRPDGAGGFYVVEQTTRQLARWSAAVFRNERRDDGDDELVMVVKSSDG